MIRRAQEIKRENVKKNVQFRLKVLIQTNKKHTNFVTPVQRPFTTYTPHIEHMQLIFYSHYFAHYTRHALCLFLFGVPHPFFSFSRCITPRCFNFHSSINYICNTIWFVEVSLFCYCFDFVVVVVVVVLVVVPIDSPRLQPTVISSHLAHAIAELDGTAVHIFAGFRVRRRGRICRFGGRRFGVNGFVCFFGSQCCFSR